MPTRLHYFLPADVPAPALLADGALDSLAGIVARAKGAAAAGPRLSGGINLFSSPMQLMR